MVDELVVEPAGTDWSWEKNKWFWGILVAIAVFMIVATVSAKGKTRSAVIVAFLCWAGLWAGGYFLGRKREMAGKA